jgi:hypothetical protein
MEGQLSVTWLITQQHLAIRESLTEQCVPMIAKVTAHKMFRRDALPTVSCHQTNIDLSLERHRALS